MTDNTVLLRCGSCGTVNRVPAGRLTEHPRCGKCRAFLDFPQRPVEVTEATFNNEVLRWPGLAIVLFWASWCAHCRGMMIILEEMAKQKAGMMKVVMINAEREGMLARRFDVMSLPKLVLFRNGVKINELNGAVERANLESWISYSG